MRKTSLARLAWLMLAASLTIFGPAAASDDPMSQEWRLINGASKLHFLTVKAGSTFEVHRFDGLEGRIGRDGEASVEIELNTLATGVDIRDVRMRFLLFETYKHPKAEIHASLDKDKLKALLTSPRLSYPLTFSLNLHGIIQELSGEVTVTRLSPNSISVASLRPVIVTAEPFGLLGGIAKLSEAVGGTPIATTAAITFDLVFEAEGKGVVLETAAARQPRTIVDAAITDEGCATRLEVLSETGAIYFRTGSAELDRASEPLLNSVLDVARRCPQVRIEVAGHTDSIGNRDANRQLSEMRARSVLGYLTQRGVDKSRIEAAGYGDTRPVAPNDSEANRSKNRRIEFAVRPR